MTENYYTRASCRICGSADLHCFLDLGSTPLADAFVSTDEVKNKEELRFPLRIGVCRRCDHIQILDVVNPRLLFPEEYALFSSAAPSLVKHFEQYAEEIHRRFGRAANKLVIEIASNDGALLTPMKKLGFTVLGVEPATNVADVCRARGINVVGDFFSEALSRTLQKQYGRAGIVSANNVLAHVDEPLDFVMGVKNILDADGVFVFEVQYGLELIRNTEFDNIYHEHLSFFTIRPLSVLMEKCGMKIFDVERVATQGGSLRCYATHVENGAHPVTEMPAKLAAMEVKEGLQGVGIYDDFAKKVLEIKKGLLEILNENKRNGKRIVGYGAPAKGNTLLNFCGIGPDLVEYCIEKTPFKFGKLTPGMHIPIVSDEIIKKDGPPDLYLLLIWNYFDSILEREKDYRERGGKFIVPIPRARVL